MRCYGSPWYGDNVPEDMTVKLRELGGRHALAKKGSGGTDKTNQQNP